MLTPFTCTELMDISARFVVETCIIHSVYFALNVGVILLIADCDLFPRIIISPNTRLRYGNLSIHKRVKLIF